MWSHYANNHAGALLVFAPRSNDSQFRIAKPVEYHDALPVLFENNKFAQLITGQISMDDDSSIEDSFDRITLTKALTWKYEKEWRIVGGDGFHPDKEVETNQFHTDDLEAVIFGARFSSDLMKPMVGCARQFYPKTKWYQSKMSKTRFGLELENIT